MKKINNNNYSTCIVSSVSVCPVFLYKYFKHEQCNVYVKGCK